MIEAGTEVGRDLNRLFTGFLQREFPCGGFQVERISDHNPTTPEEVVA